MDRRPASDPSFWHYLIKDQRATEQLDQLCHGLAQIISKLEPGTDGELSPQRLANFYRIAGCNLDSVFLDLSHATLSFMYATLGCFHSLQPSPSPFKPPQIPCLTPAGFSRWITIQIMLVPETHVGLLQQAVRIWDVPGPNGTVFPKYIPQDVFPNKPDEEMEQWYNSTTEKLKQGPQQRRIKNSPYQSPHLDPQDRRDGYFSSSLAGRPSRLSRSSSRDDKDQMAALYRRRSSVPDVPSPHGDRGSRWDGRTQEALNKSRSHSAQRPTFPPSRHRSHTTTGSPTQSRYSTNPPPKSHSSRRHHAEPSGRPFSDYNGPHRSPARTPSTVDENTGSEASSENSQLNRRSRRPDEGRKSRRSSLWPPSFLRSHKRRHSSDAGYRGSSRYDPPLRPEYYALRPIESSNQPGYRGSGPPHFREPTWDSDPARSNPGTLNQVHSYVDPRSASTRYQEQPDFYSLRRESSSGSGTENRHRASDMERNAHRRPGATPSRVTTVSGVHGRKYPDALGPIERHRGPGPPRSGIAAAV
ncbi:hypothetical protein PV10_00684 [Exophiala mesophila]|uniref:DUF7514 domain-containing protein n=1 Tax=Exophiala mesophila TaxID=212818 RepID=A0A0D1X4Y9_EXOME|nr:uncharacterized protein PV10_00684 [Exophiala mesophila]KIV96870.1 hypothetical protein PV10_00684 [Exophiala mesophila]